MRWKYWLFEAKKRYGLCVLNYIATSNHIHLLVVDTSSDVIPRSLQLIAGRVAQEYNQRKQRKGAFWEDRYHATAVESGEHLAKWFVYIDLNMIRAGVVHHPSDYSVAGYNEIQGSPNRYRIIDIPKLQDLFALAGKEFFREVHKNWVKSELNNEVQKRNPLWSESVAIGSDSFVQNIQHQLGWRVKGRTITTKDEATTLQEPHVGYNA